MFSVCSGSHGGNFWNRDYIIRTSASCSSISCTPSVNILTIMGTRYSAINMRMFLPAIVALRCQQERKSKKRKVSVCVYVHVCIKCITSQEISDIKKIEGTCGGSTKRCVWPEWNQLCEGKREMKTERSQIIVKRGGQPWTPAPSPQLSLCYQYRTQNRTAVIPTW